MYTMAYCTILVLLAIVSTVTGTDSSESTDQSSVTANPDTVTNIRQKFTWDPNGYIFFCLCMGRFGNQADHFLGSLAFAKRINRTLVLPPFRTYRNVMFTEWFKQEVVAQYHRVILAEDFMKHLAPKHWPVGHRIGFCWLPQNSDAKCVMKEGNPFGPFWDGLKVDFDDYIIYHLSYYETERWNEEYPGDKYPVIAMRGAPAGFPISPADRQLQRYLVFSDKIENDANSYISKNFPDQKFVGIHLRNGADWVNACKGTEGMRSMMASTQCLDGTGQRLTHKICFPPEQEVLRLVKNVIVQTRAKVIFVATDQNPMTSKIEEHLKKWKVKVYHLDPWLPLDDLAILIKSDHFIGNCVSSFTAYVKRVRDLEGKPTSFWGFS
ncbi:hypothetical protein NP493_409g01017 [Ridgeia piscesae]|uniref:GDP-fucose protein O-fucosyltransferase 1 n=1 Tax=Ridgeia piscesae TaxID=27915 RepID=A0AAD9NVG5_RIDPI|nr:hypothetical protein NP493_409g01017 [Ridgeia piscesae]